MNISIEKISQNIAVEFVKKYHYSKIIPKITRFYLGICLDNSLVGVVLLGYGTQPYNTIQKIFYRHKMETSDYIEIGKMCFIDTLNNDKCFGSMTMSKLIQWLKNNTNYHFLYTLADGIVGKCGYIYQASNFTYIGKFKTSVYLDNNTGEKIHPRSSNKLLEENARFEKKEKLFWLTDSFCKFKNIDLIQGYMFRYIYPLNKNAKKLLLEYNEYLNIPYPKDGDLIYEKRIAKGKFKKISKPEFNRDVLNYNYQCED